MNIKSELATVYHPTRTAEALMILSQATAEKKIYNVDFEATKSTLTRAFEKLYQERISKVYFWGGLYEKLSEAEDKASDNISVSSIPSVLSALKKVKAYKGEQTQFMKDLTEVIEGLAAVATEINELKPFIVKGRKPSGKAPAPENPNKIVKTCACCFRDIAVGSDGKMVHHGYRRPGDGFQTNSCMGINYLPLEVSNEGLVALISVIQRQLTDLETRLANLGPDSDLVDYRGRAVEKGTPEHRRAESNTRYSTESQIRQNTRFLEDLNVKLANWKPE